MLLGANAVYARRVAPFGFRIEPFWYHNVQPASYDLHLGPTAILLPESHLYDAKDARTYLAPSESITLTDKGYVLPNNRLLLASTLERVTLPIDLSGRVDGKSSLGRQGLPIHVTAGNIDPGFDGVITLELHTICGLRTVLYPGMPIGQLSLFLVEDPSLNATYFGKYQHADGPQESRYYMNWDGAQWK